jgi:small-conductance mechanosensitive channel
MTWYAQTIATQTATALDDTFLPLLRRILIVVIYVIGALVLLDSLGIAVTPMLTGLGVTGLAVALALQPTLASFFAGLQVITDQVVAVGDFVELDSGVRGYVVEVGWRSTRIRSTYQNLIVVPNSRLVESIITNYDSPIPEVAVIVEAGVSYSNDLAQVEEIVLDVTRQVIQELPEAVKDGDPWFGFDAFGESNINFWVWHYATDYLATFRFKSELIKRLPARFKQEGIEINYPVRKLIQE